MKVSHDCRAICFLPTLGRICSTLEITSAICDMLDCSSGVDDLAAPEFDVWLLSFLESPGCWSSPVAAAFLTPLLGAVFKRLAGLSRLDVHGLGLRLHQNHQNRVCDSSQRFLDRKFVLHHHFGH